MFEDTSSPKSASVNFRIMPSHKERLLRQSKIRGLNLTDYIGIALEKAEQDAVQVQKLAAENTELRAQYERIAAELQQYDAIVDPYAIKFIGKQSRVGGKVVLAADKFALLKQILHTYKFSEK